MRPDFSLILLIGLFSIVFISCQKEDDNFEKDKINFEHLEVGQVSRYLLLKGEDYKNINNQNFIYERDTLVTEIVSKDEIGFLVKEYLTPGSASLNGENNVAYADSAIFYHFRLAGDSLSLIPQNERVTSRIFFFQYSLEDFLMLESPVDLEVSFPGWKTNLPYSTNKIEAFTRDFVLFGSTYDTLNVVIDNRPLKSREPGFTHVFSRENGLVRSSQYSWYTNKGYGWDLLP